MPRLPLDQFASRRITRNACAAVLLAVTVQALAVNGQMQLPTEGSSNSVPVNAPPANIEPTIEAYPLNETSRSVLTAWQQQAAGRTDIRVAIDERSGQALVFAPPAIHMELRRQLTSASSAAPAQQPSALPAPSQGAPNQPPLPSQATNGQNASPQLNTAILQLRNVAAADLRPRLEQLLTRQLPASVDATGDWQGFAVEATPGASVTMNVNTRTGQVRIDGAPPQVAAWRSVVEALDSGPAAPGSVTQLVATTPGSHQRVRQALQVLQASAQNQVAPGQRVALLQQTPDQGGAGQPDAAVQAPAGQETTQLAPGSEQTALDAARLAEAAGGLLGPVQVEYVEGLDIIVLRGSERDVQRVMDIIQQIEQLSQVTVPTIEIYQLVHTDSMQLGVLLNRLYTEVLGPRIGTVSITPLGTPNALLLIGRQQTVQAAIDLIKKLDQPAAPAAQFQVFPLQNASVEEAKTLIDAFLRQDEEGEPQQEPDEEGPITDADSRPPLAPRALVVADIRTNYLIVRASPRDLAEIAALLARIDAPGAAAQLKVFTIQNGDANTLVTTLRTLFSVPAEGEPEAPGGVSQGGVVRLQFSVDPRTNSIIAAGNAADLEVVEAILLRLDQGNIRERITTVHRLNNAFADFLANALNIWLQTQQQAEAEAAVAISPFEQFEREVIIVPEAATNSLIVSATPRIYNEVIEVIRKLDERPPMVMIQVLIAEVRLNDTDEFGIELGLQDSLLFDRSLLGELTTITTTTDTQSPGGTIVTTTQDTIVNAPGQPGFNFNNQPLGNNLSSAALATAANVATQGLSSFSLNRVNNELGFGGFVFSASSNSVSVLLRALQENRRLEVLSRPQLMALDGQPGQVQVGQNVPRIVQTTIDPISGTTNTIQYEPVGLILQVVPRISPDGLVVLQIIANKSEVGPEAEGIPISISPAGQVLRAPRIEITQAQTTVSALSGQTVILGGLLQTRKFDVHRRVPLIADIPLIGDLFRYDAVSEERRELLIILTPRIIYGKEDADLVKQIESSRMSWILGDVINLHGEAGLRSRCDEWQDADIEAVYPNFVPEEGVLPLSEGRATPGDGPALLAPVCEPVVIPETMVTPTPVGQPTAEDGAAVPSPPLPPQGTDPSAIQPQSAVPPEADRYGFIAPAVPAQTSSSPLRLPETDE
jgi:type II secretion system protein D